MKRHRLILVGLAAGVLALGGCSSGSVNEQTQAQAPASSAPAAGGTSDDPAVQAAKDTVAKASSATEGFTPPEGGPKAQKSGATIVFVGADLTNGGINAVGAGVKEAGDAIGWKTTILDGKASAQGRTEALSQAIAMKPAGIVLGGFDAKEQAATIKEAADQKIPVVGWHAGPTAGAMPDYKVFTNVTTEATDVAKLSAAYAIADSNGTAGVAIFTDRQYDIAVAKSDAIKDSITACKGCSVLEYENSPIAEADSRMPSIVANLLQQHGEKLTYLIGINGNYCGGAQSALRAAGVSGDGPPKCVAAGDGDDAEFQRIRNHDFQSATVAEPVNLQGWQLVDELNRAIAGEQPSGFVAQPGLITADNVPAQGMFDPESGYRDIYKKNWGV